MLVTNKENLIEASKNGYAIPALNTQGGNYDIIWAACRAAEEMKSPIILAHYVLSLIHIFWHCGNAAPSLFNKEYEVEIRNHQLAGQGTAFYGALKPGKVTVARFFNID